MSLLKELGTGQGYLKAGFLGFPKSGKTWTAFSLAIGTRALFKSKGPIAMFDTEGGSEYIAARVKSETGKNLLGYKGRSFDDLMKMAHECVVSGVSVLVVDSITHVWRELCESYLRNRNDLYKQKGWKPKSDLEFQDWGKIKRRWQDWPDFYLNADLHIIICGRAGYEYEMKEDEKGKKELTKTGTKMKVEAEFGFEPSLLVEMERDTVRRGDSEVVVHRATIIGDRFNQIDGAVCEDPTFEFFRPHVELLAPGAHSKIDVEHKSEVGLDESLDDEWAREKKARTIICEEIQGILTQRWPGATAAEKKAKVDILHEAFGTRSWTAIEGTKSHDLREGLRKLKELMETSSEQGDSAGQSDS